MAGALERLAGELSEMGFKVAKANAGKVDVKRVVDELRLGPIREVPALQGWKGGRKDCRRPPETRIFTRA
ncbi:MAG: hypothetical protein DRN61_02840 [Thaumarchaeota archaeon]|nr:MAG: hypothetical protein DRN61_02840 [Nitrososphaerota archaeon]